MLEKIKCPVLASSGDRDLQVDTVENCAAAAQGSRKQAGTKNLRCWKSKASTISSRKRSPVHRRCMARSKRPSHRKYSTAIGNWVAKQHAAMTLRTGCTLRRRATAIETLHGIIEGGAQDRSCAAKIPPLPVCFTRINRSAILKTFSNVATSAPIFRSFSAREASGEFALALHYSGPLLLWIETNHPEYFELLRSLVQRKQVEMVGGGFYEPILAVIPPEDQREQIERMTAYLDEHFGERPSGAWLAERVWEPQLPSVLAASQVQYTLVDDFHFLSAGFEPQRTIRRISSRRSRERSAPVCRTKGVSLSDSVRKSRRSNHYLREAAAMHPDGVAAFGDDMEKFGVWPGTFEHCYDEYWLENFLSALEANADWLSLTPPGEYAKAQGPLGRADLPTASYPEMGEWALPTPVRQRFHAVQQELSWRPEVISFLQGGSWRGFFRKYPEANLLHKKMLRVGTRLQQFPRRTGIEAGKGMRRRSRICCYARSATTPTGTAFLADSTRRICAPSSGAI